MCSKQRIVMGGGVQSDQFSTIKYNGLIDIIVIILLLPVARAVLEICVEPRHN